MVVGQLLSSNSGAPTAPRPPCVSPQVRVARFTLDQSVDMDDLGVGESSIASDAGGSADTELACLMFDLAFAHGPTEFIVGDFEVTGEMSGPPGSRAIIYLSTAGYAFQQYVIGSTEDGLIVRAQGLTGPSETVQIGSNFRADTPNYLNLQGAPLRTPLALTLSARVYGGASLRRLRVSATSRLLATRDPPEPVLIEVDRPAYVKSGGTSDLPYVVTWNRSLPLQQLQIVSGSESNATVLEISQNQIRENAIAGAISVRPGSGTMAFNVRAVDSISGETAAQLGVSLPIKPASGERPLIFILAAILAAASSAFVLCRAYVHSKSGRPW